MPFISLAPREYLSVLLFGVQYPFFWQQHLSFHLGPVGLVYMGLDGRASTLDPVVNQWCCSGLMRSSEPPSHRDWLVKEWARVLVKSTVPGLCPGARYTGHSRVTQIFFISGKHGKYHSLTLK